ncbi:MAG: M4 family metallopeptidase [Verrucomicrobiae bacterium]|nr:M4 family metallopeptidase [Verrucomicrobiae bacterium]
MLHSLAARASGRIRECALRTVEQSERLRGHRDMLAFLGAVSVVMPTGTKRRTIYDCQHKTKLPGVLLRGENDPPTNDRAADEAYDHSGITYDFFKTVYGRNSIDDGGMRIDSSVHYGVDYDNAFWNGMQMVYGDGDGEVFQSFTSAIEVVAHELTHGIIQYEAGLIYYGEPGALNESFADVFGVLAKQWMLRQTAEQADWLVGVGLFTSNVNASALRSMKAPGTAYDDPILGKDPQPGHMRDFYKGPDDSGGVHINSGIPNHAFYLAATRIGGYGGDGAGRIWYEALCNRLRPTADFKSAAKATIDVAATLYGRGSKEQQAVKTAWEEVGVI